MEQGDTLIVITYLAEAAQGDELHYAIEGWRRHFLEPYHIVVIGEGVPEPDGDDITCIESKRVPPKEGQYRAHLDYVNCLRKVRKAFPSTEGFILVADDCYAVNDFTLDDVKTLKCLKGEVDFDPESPNMWRRDKMRTKRALEDILLPCRNFTTHLPIWYEWNKWEAIVKMFRMDEVSHVIEDLYHNYYYTIAPAIVLGEDDDIYKCSVYSSRPNPARLRREAEERIWVTNNPDGWVAPLKELLKEHFG
jgi:hypothetical protein